MESIFPILAFMTFAAVIGCLLYLSYLHRKQRREAMAALADSLGWRFDPDYDSSHDDQYSQFEIFRRGHGRYAYNTLHGTVTIDADSCSAKMGDFTYKVTSGSGKSRRTRTYHFSYLVVHLPFRKVPDLLIRSEGWFDKLSAAFGFDDIDFESVEFSKRFCVKSSDKRFAYDVVHPRMMEFMLQTNPPTIDIEHGACCLAEGHRQWSAEEFRAQLDWVCGFLSRWPDHVKADLKI